MSKEIDCSISCDLSVGKAKKRFKKKLSCFRAVSGVAACSKNFDIESEAEGALREFEALGAKNSLQEMLVAQMTSVHELQQISAGMAHRASAEKVKQYHTNSAIKLANCFTQQAALLAKLQGHASQKITIERVDVREGAQAIVGNVNGIGSGLGEKK